MRFKKWISFLLVSVTAVTLSSCGSEDQDRTTQLLNVDNASQGQLIWDDSEPDSATWRLQCASPVDFKWLMGLSLQQIKTDTSLRSYCEDAAKTISMPTPFTVESANLEIDAFLAALPKYEICSSIFRYRMSLIAEEEAQTAYDAAVTSKELGDFVGGSLDLNEAMEFQSKVEIYKWTHEESAVKISKTPAADLCGNIQF